MPLKRHSKMSLIFLITKIWSLHLNWIKKNICKYIDLLNWIYYKNIDILSSYVSSIPSGLFTEKEVNFISTILIASIDLSRSTYIIAYKNDCLGSNWIP